MKGLHRQYLEAMGIRVWQRRQSFQPAGEPVADVEEETTPAMSLSAPPEDDSDIPPPPAQKQGEKQLPAPASEDIPAEYMQWAMSTNDDREHDFELDPAPAEDPRARIARMDWDELESEVRQCTACELHKTRTQGVFGVGSRKADWMIIGEAPGADEDRLGEPFVGRAGKLLDAMLLALDLNRERVYIANILKSRPPNNRDPRPEEVRTCWPYLQRQIELIQPRILLAVGRIAAQNLLQTDVTIGKLRGRVYRFGETGIPLVVTYHPAYLLRSPGQKRKAWEDLQLAFRVLSGAAG